MSFPGQVPVGELANRLSLGGQFVLTMLMSIDTNGWAQHVLPPV